KKKQLWLHSEAFGQFQSLSISERELGRGLIRQCSQPCEFEVRHRRFASLAHIAFSGRKHRPSGYVLQHGHFWERLHDLKSACDASRGDLVGFEPLYAFPVMQNLTGL